MIVTKKKLYGISLTHCIKLKHSSLVHFLYLLLETDDCEMATLVSALPIVWNFPCQVECLSFPFVGLSMVVSSAVTQQTAQRHWNYASVEVAHFTLMPCYRQSFCSVCMNGSLVGHIWQLINSCAGDEWNLAFEFTAAAVWHQVTCGSK